MPNIFVRAWNKRKEENKIKRFVIPQGNLFITTGLISLINAMAIIKQENKKDNCLIVYTAYLTDSFKKISKKITLRKYFSRIVYLDNTNFDAFIQKIDLNCFDSLFIANQPQFKFFQEHHNINLLEEGISSYFDFGNLSEKGLKGIYLSNFLDKMNYNKKEFLPFVKQIQKENQLYVINKIRKKNHINFSYLKRDNQILLMHHYILQDIMTQEECLSVYITEINKLIQNGYNVLFKVHPRVEAQFLEKLKDYYKDNPHFQFFPFEASYPVEILISDIQPCAFVSSMSGGGVSCSHLYNIPTYEFGHDIARYPGMLDQYRKLLQKTQLPVKELYEDKQ